LWRELVSKKKLCLFFEDVMNREVLDGRDVVNTGEEAEEKPLSSASLDVFTTLTDSYQWSLDERNCAAFMDCSHSGVGATRFASAVQYEHAMKRPCGPGPSRAAFCKPTFSLPGPAAAGSIPLRAV
jgi:hypothetical protein